MKKVPFSVFCLLCLLCGCTQDAYDKGEGEYSLVRADFAEAHSNGQKQIDYIVTDDGEQLPTAEPYSLKWVEKADTLYRGLFYYNKVERGSGQFAAELVSAGQVPCMQVRPLAKLVGEMKTDPVKFESAWMSKSGKYLNLGLYLMTGSTDDEEAMQHLALVQDTVVQNPDNTRTSYVRLYHDQGGVPEYYSTQVYASIPTNRFDADSVRLTINTYQGQVTKSFLIPWTE